MINFQEMIIRLTQFWAQQGCLIHQGYDLEVGAGTFNPATFLRCLGPEPYAAVYVEPSRRPQDGRYGENPNRVQFYHQMQVIIKPSPANIQDLYLQSLEAIGLDLNKHDIRFVHDDWENPTIGAWGLGWEVWADGMEVTQFTYFQAVGGIPVKPVSGELTYGLERLALYLQGVDSFFDLKWNDEISYGDIYKRSEWEWSHYNFTEANTEMWMRHFEDYEKEAIRLVKDHLPIPAYDFVMKASHAFNLLDARGVISVTERTGYMGRIRQMAKSVAESYLLSREKQNYPLLKMKKDVPPKAIPRPSTVCAPNEKEDFLLEVGSEELPASFVPIGMRNLEAQTLYFLKENNLPFEGIHSFGTPRRLAIHVKGLAGGTEPKSIERKGPALSAAFDEKGVPTRAGLGFFCSLGLEVASLEQVEKGEIPELEIQEVKGQHYLFAHINLPGKSTRALLAEALPDLILKVEFPKKMRWGELEIEYARPLRWCVALYGSEVIPFAVGAVVSDRLSHGHRQLDNNHSFPLAHPKEYLKTLKEHWVMASVEERKASILEQIQDAEARLKGTALVKDRVMAEVLHLVEWPFVTETNFDRKFLSAPKEVLISEMVEHQKYFPVGDEQGGLLPYFLIVCNNQPSDLIRSGNQKALSPRLADGVFLYEEDLKTSLDTFNEQLKKMTFRKELGSVWDKVKRLEQFVEALRGFLPIADAKKVVRAAELSKADLASQLVGEFPELQGHVGAIYARKQGEAEEVAVAIEEHWMPRGEKASLPQSSTGTLLSLADKIDNFLSCFSLGLKPSSSSDPYALRRQGIGMIKILIEQKLFLPLSQVFNQTFEIFSRNLLGTFSPSELVVKEIEDFLLSRLRTIFVEEGFGKDEVEAVIAQGLTDCYALHRKIQALHSFRSTQSEKFLAVNEVYTRAKKILFSQNPRLIPGWLANRYTTEVTSENRYPPVDPQLFQDDSEKQLFESLRQIEKRFHLEILDRRDPKKHNYTLAFSLLADLQNSVSHFFDSVKVIEKDPLLRTNRLSLLQSIWDLCEELIDFSKLQIEC